MKKSKSLAEFCKGLRQHDQYLLSCHVLPEGDAIGSLLAMDSLLRRLGKKTTSVCEDSFPERLACLSSKGWRRASEVKRPAGGFASVLVADCPNLDRIGTVQALLGPETVVFNVDHHISNIFFGDFNYVRPKAAASGEVVMDIFRHLHMPLTQEEAKNIYVALSTDTGSFKYGNTTVHSHLMAADLIKTGIPLEKINEELYSTYSLNKMNLYSRLLGRVKTAAGGRVAWVAMRREDLKHSGATYEDTEGFIDFLKYLKEVKVAFFMGEAESGCEVKISFRSKGPYDVNKIATHFRGGGHKKASGCNIQGTLEEAEKKILDCLRRQFHFDQK